MGFWPIGDGVAGAGRSTLTPALSLPEGGGRLLPYRAALPAYVPTAFGMRK